MWLLGMAVALGADPSRSAGADGILGLWTNSNSTVVVDVTRCGRGICGRVVRASAGAETDARQAGSPPIVGTQVLRDFELRRPGIWSGRVFVPARNRIFHSTLTRVDDRRIRIDACILGGLICQGEVWRRAAG
jgi:uncharacterized protein (DUF2147 family)